MGRNISNLNNVKGVPSKTVTVNGQGKGYSGRLRTPPELISLMRQTGSHVTAADSSLAITVGDRFDAYL